MPSATTPTLDTKLRGLTAPREKDVVRVSGCDPLRLTTC